MTETSTRSYDDLPESDVSTVLQVPLLWGAHRDQRSRAVPGRHRPAVRDRTPTNGVGLHPLVRVLEVGVTSALLVLVLFGVALLALAKWMP